MVVSSGGEAARASLRRQRHVNNAQAEAERLRKVFGSSDMEDDDDDELEDSDAPIAGRSTSSARKNGAFGANRLGIPSSGKRLRPPSSEEDSDEDENDGDEESPSLPERRRHLVTNRSTNGTRSSRATDRRQQRAKDASEPQRTLLRQRRSVNTNYSSEDGNGEVDQRTTRRRGARGRSIKQHVDTTGSNKTAARSSVRYRLSATRRRARKSSATSAGSRRDGRGASHNAFYSGDADSESEEYSTAEQDDVLGSSSAEEDDDEDDSSDDEPKKVMERILAKRPKKTEGHEVAPDKKNDERTDGEANKAAENAEEERKAKTSGMDGPAAKKGGDAASMRKKGRGDNKIEDEEETSDTEYEYLLKWKDLAYIHCEWVPEEVVLAQSQGRSRLQRFHCSEDAKIVQRGSNDEEISGDEVAIPEGYCTVDRILAQRVDSAKRKQYLVKWRDLPYAECTWEYEEDVKDDEKIIEYQQRNEMPKAELLKPQARPPPSHYSTQTNPKLRNAGELREYQMEGYNWLINCWYHRQGSILADEMGLGKTIQSVAFCHYLHNEEGVRGPFLVIAPLSTLGHWQREFETWTWLNAIVYHGNVKSRENIRTFEWTYAKQANAKGPPYKWHALITTYETILQEASRLKQIKWSLVLVDEAHRLKNRSSKLIEELRGFSSEHRILLTGTPIQNTSLEVWSLLNYLEPEKFPSEESFSREFGDVRDSNTVERLKTLLRPYLLRRLKEDVERSIPPKEETIVSVELTRIQKKWYRAMLEQNFSFLDKNAKTSNVGNLRNIVMELRKCCNHPYLIKGVENVEMEANPPKDEDESMKRVIEASGKLVLVDKLLPQLKQNGHKVLIFSQMIRVLDILEDYLIARRWGYERIDGNVRGNDRQQAIDRFCKPNSDKFVFLLCTRAGGQGINLTVADTVIIYDSDWNPQNDVQAQARCHRIGQKNDVKIYRLITRATYEMDMFDRASKKLGLDQAVLQNMGLEKKDAGGSAGLLNDLKREEVDSLLRRGAYDVFNEDNSAADAFTAEDINQILERRTTLVRTGAETTGPSAFSKANFAAEDSKDSTAVELNDPDFWKKLMPGASAAPDPNIQFLPRRRRQTQRYVPLEEHSSGEDVDNESSDEVIGGVSPSGKPLWNKEERKRLYRGIMNFGWGRWEDVARFTELGEKRSLDEIAVMTRNLLRLAVQNYVMSGESDDDESTAAGTNRGGLMERYPILDHVQGPHRTILSAENNDGGEDAEIQDDEPSAENEKRPWMQLKQYREGPEIVEPLNIEPVLLSNEFSSFLSRNAVHIFERLELLNDLVQLDLNGDLEADQPVPTVGSSGNQALGDWWDNDFDRALLKGTLKYGYGNYESMRQDPKLHFLGRVEPVIDEEEEDDAEADGESGDAEDGDESSKSDEDRGDNPTRDAASVTTPRNVDVESNGAATREKTAPPKKKELVAHIALDELYSREWPSVHKLNSRVKKLVKAYIRMKKKMERKMVAELEVERVRRQREEQRLQKLAEQQHERERRQHLLNITWTKKERHDLSRYYTTVGATPLDKSLKNEDYEQVISRAKLPRKTVEIVEKYAKEFHDMCVQCADLQRNAKKPVAPTFSVEKLEEARMTPATAKRFLDRHRLVRMVRKVRLKNPVVLRLIETQARPYQRDNLPVWWGADSAKFDVALLRGIAREGCDVVAIVLSEDLPFREACAEEVIKEYRLAHDAREKREVEEAKKEEVSTSGPEAEEEVGEGASSLPPIPKPEAVEPNDLLNVFPKEKIVLARAAHLVDAASLERLAAQQAKEAAERAALAAKEAARREAQAIKDARAQAKEELALASGTSGRRNSRKRSQSSAGISTDLAVVEEATCGSMCSAFESGIADKLSKGLLRTLKRHKKSTKEGVLEVSLADWPPPATLRAR